MKTWKIRQPDTLRQKGLSDALSISPIISQLLINRGLENIDEARTFLRGTIGELHNPFLMEGMHKGVTRIKKAIENREKILIHGDYDVDGITAISLLMFTLGKQGIKPDYYIPDRLTEGYGLSANGVNRAIELGVTLVITVDCGVSSHEEVKTLNAHNIDVIITDHHEVPKDLPLAHSIINPLRKDCAYPEKYLSGAGVAFKLCEALSSGSDNKGLLEHLDLVSLGTIADVVPLVGENRLLVKEGLKILNNGTSNKGIRALIEENGIEKRKLSSFEVAFILAPRINAAGRMGSPAEAVELLLTENVKEAEALAKKLNQANRERQRIESSTLKEAMEIIDKEINFKDHKIIVLHNEDWHTGVIGIVASRITDRFYRPTILISTKDGVGRGSGRSVENFHLFDALAACEDVLKEYGGHKYACGLTILEENLGRFKKAINEIAHSRITPEILTHSLDIDMEVRLSSLDKEIVEALADLEPFGEGNKRPLFCSRNLRLTRPVRILKNEHIKLWVTDGKKNFEAIGFRLARNSDIMEALKKSTGIDLVYSLSFNTWQGLTSIQLKIEDIKPSALSRL